MANNFLLDTHVILWAFFQPEKLSKEVVEILQSKENTIFISAISFWEIGIKYKNKKLVLNNINPEQLLNACIDNDFKILDIDTYTIASSYKLEKEFHKDPFDKMLIWIALQKKFTFISNDKMVQKYTTIGLKVKS